MQERKRTLCYQTLKGAYVKMAHYLQTRLPLDSALLIHLKCLGPSHRTSPWTVASFRKLCSLLPHVITEREISLAQDQWKLLQMETVSESWHTNEDGTHKRLDVYWAKIFDIKSDNGEKKYDLIAKVMKSCLTLQNGNAAVERSLSDNKNTLTAKRTNLSDDTLMGLRRMKEHARSAGGAHNVDTISKELIMLRKRKRKLLRN